MTSFARISAAISSGGLSSFVLCRRRSRKKRSLFAWTRRVAGSKKTWSDSRKSLGNSSRKPLFVHASHLREKNDQFVVPALDFADLTRDEQWTLLHHALSSENSVPAVNEIAAQCPCINPFGQMIRKADQHGFAEGFGIELVDSFVDVEPFGPGDVNELFENLSYLLGYGIANAKAASFVCAVLAEHRARRGLRRRNLTRLLCRATVPDRAPSGRFRFA